MKHTLTFFIFTFLIFAGILYYVNFKPMNTTTDTTMKNTVDANTLQKAYFAGGCFWCMEGIFEAQTGVTQAISGYAWGTSEDATYELVSAGRTNHREVVEIIYDPSMISYTTLVDLYFTQIDPTQADGQFADKGYRYTTAILYMTLDEKVIAEAAIAKLDASKKFDKPIAVKVEPKTTFFAAEEYHQDYYKKSAFRYNLYKEGSGRKWYIDETWTNEIKNLEKPKTEELKEKLTDIQYRVTQEEGTEQPFSNPYWDNHAPWIYVDIVDGSPLFASLDKFDSGTGWPSFTRVMTGASIVEKKDTKLGTARIEVRSRNADSHLGHLFDDGPVDRGWMRYCINSAALRFIPVSELVKEGYGEYVQYFLLKKKDI